MNIIRSEGGKAVGLQWISRTFFITVLLWGGLALWFIFYDHFISMYMCSLGDWMLLHWVSSASQCGGPEWFGSCEFSLSLATMGGLLVLWFMLRSECQFVVSLSVIRLVMVSRILICFKVCADGEQFSRSVFLCFMKFATSFYIRGRTLVSVDLSAKAGDVAIEGVIVGHKIPGWIHICHGLSRCSPRRVNKYR